MRNILWSLEPVQVINSPVADPVPSARRAISSGTFQVEDDPITVGWHVIPAHHAWDDSWELSRDLIVEVRSSRAETVALTRWTVGEYGLGANSKAAIYDLLTSLSDYREVLEAREGRLADSALGELKALQALVHRRDAK